MPNVAIVHYSSTGNVYDLARAIEEGAQAAGADTRLLKVRELAPPEAIDSRPEWRAHVEATADVPEATSDDLVWADAYIFGSPTRYGNVAAQLKQFIDAQGPLWAEGKLADKVAAAFTSTTTAHGGQETTLQTLYTVFMHWGCLLVPPGYTDPIQFEAGNPYGVSHFDANGTRKPEGATLEAARYLGGRVARFAGIIAPAVAEQHGSGAVGA